MDSTHSKDRAELTCSGGMDGGAVSGRSRMLSADRRPVYTAAAAVLVAAGSLAVCGLWWPASAQPVSAAARVSTSARVSSVPKLPLVAARRVPRGLGDVVWDVLPTSRKVVAITIDGGWNPAGVKSMLATLRRYHVRATFNITGRFCRHYPAYAKAIAADGELIGNLSNNHPHFPTISDRRIREEVLDGQAEIKAVTAKDPWPWFRFPYGDYDAHDVYVVNSLGFVPIGWTVDTLGWEGTSGGITVQIVVDRVLASLRPGEIVLMHFASNLRDHSILDADALPIVIRKLRADGYSFVTVSALLRMTAASRGQN